MWIKYPAEGSELSAAGVYEEASLICTDCADEFLVRDCVGINDGQYEVVATGMIGGDNATYRVLYRSTDKDVCNNILRMIFDAILEDTEGLDITE